MSTGQIEVFGHPNFVAAAHLKRGARVTLDGNGQAILAGADERGIGTVYMKDAEPGETFAVRPWSDAGVHMCIASAAIPVGSKIIAAANGEVAAGDTGTVIGARACSATYPVGQAGDQLGVMPIFT